MTDHVTRTDHDRHGFHVDAPHSTVRSGARSRLNHRNLPRTAMNKINPIPYPQTPKTAREYIHSHGLNLSELARDHDISRYVLIDLLRGRNKGLRGHAHRGAVLLGLKPEPTP